jgi:hypothetical protein
MERRVVIKPVKQPSPVKKYLRRHPLVRTIMVTIAFSATLALAGALINWATSHIPGNTSSANPLVVPPLGGGGHSSSPSATPTKQPQSFGIGSCLAGDFSGSKPKTSAR